MGVLERVLGVFIEDNICLQRLRVSRNALLLSIIFHDDANNFAPLFAFCLCPHKARQYREDAAGQGSLITAPDRHRSEIRSTPNGGNLLRFIVNNPVIQLATGYLPPINVPTSVVGGWDPKAGIPYSVQYSVGVERQ